MLVIQIPGFKKLSLVHLVLDFNGTIAVDGKLIAGVGVLLNRLSKVLKVHILTGDIHGTAREELKDIHCILHVVPLKDQISAKAQYIHKLFPDEVVAIGNGRNDYGMMEKSNLRILVIGEEGGSSEIFKVSDVIVGSIINALNLLLTPQRLVATLRA